MLHACAVDKLLREREALGAMKGGSPGEFQYHRIRSRQLMYTVSPATMQVALSAAIGMAFNKVALCILVLLAVLVKSGGTWLWSSDSEDDGKCTK